jgi:NitT/TauT family transport system substrate-binding protein
MSRLALAALVLVSALGCGMGPPPPAATAGLEKSSLRLAVGGQSQIVYLPLTLAVELGYFRAEGLNVEIKDLKDPSLALESLLSGSVDMVAGYYEQTVRAQTQGKSLHMVASFEDYPGLVLMVGKQHQEQVRSIRDIAGHPVGVVSAGSPSEEMIRYLLKKQNLAPDAVPLLAIGSGGTAIAAISSGQVWAGVTVDPTTWQLERQGGARALYDTRTAEGALQVWGGSWPAAGFYASSDFIERNPRTVQAMVRAAVRSLKFISGHPASEIAQHVPAGFLVNGDRAAFEEMLRADLGIFSETGLMASDGPIDVLETLRAADPRTDWSTVALNRTFDNSFVQKAAQVSPSPGSGQGRS